MTSVLLAAPISTALAGAGWTSRAPRAALVLWQAVCLAAGLCLIGAGFVLALQPLGHNIFTALWQWLSRLLHGHPLAGMTGQGILTGTLATSAAGILFGVLVRSIVLTVRRRRAHRVLLDLLTGDRLGSAHRSELRRNDGSSTRHATRPDVGDLLADVRILDHSAAVAYTLPGWHSRVVLSVGMLDLLSRAELIAVIGHERAHVRSRHDLLVLPFQAWATALGWLPGVRAAAASVAELTEMLADDCAVRRSTPSVLARALATVALAAGPGEFGSAAAYSPVSAGAVAARVERLLQPSPLPRSQLAGVYLLAIVLLLLPTVPLLIGWS